MRRSPWSAVAFWIVVVASWVLPWAGHAQSAGRRAATLASLSGSPIFFHGQEVVVQADAVRDGVLTYLVDGEERLVALDVPPPPAGTAERLEVSGRFYDVGRLEPGDSRTGGLPFARISELLLGKPWPGVGELLVLAASDMRGVAGTPAVTLRTLALDPAAYLDRAVTVTGRFRGRNLYGDLPRPAGRSRWDFVLASVDAAVWVVGREPKGDGFELDVQARIDTGRWLRVTGRVESQAGMVLIDAAELALADPPATPRPRPRAAARRGPPPEVIFSAPLPDDTDVPPDTTVRIQFSSDMDPDSFEGRVAVSYGGRQPAGGADAGGEGLTFETFYRARNRVLELRFDAELEPFRTLDVRLLDGITATDGQPLPPWALSFFVGG